jgi:hypothetical protein
MALLSNPDSTHSILSESRKLVFITAQIYLFHLLYF